MIRRGKMSKVWTGYKDIDEIVGTIKRIYREAGELPEILVSSIRKSLKSSTYGMIQRFYNRLNHECPEALKYFYNEKGEGDESKNIT
jgi:hypothetical protein